MTSIHTQTEILIRYIFQSKIYMQFITRISSPHMSRRQPGQLRTLHLKPWMWRLVWSRLGLSKYRNHQNGNACWQSTNLNSMIGSSRNSHILKGPSGEHMGRSRISRGRERRVFTLSSGRTQGWWVRRVQLVDQLLRDSSHRIHRGHTSIMIKLYHSYQIRKGKIIRNQNKKRKGIHHKSLYGSRKHLGQAWKRARASRSFPGMERATRHSNLNQDKILHKWQTRIIAQFQQFITHTSHSKHLRHWTTHRVVS